MRWTPMLNGIVHTYTTVEEVVAVVAQLGKGNVDIKLA